MIIDLAKTSISSHDTVIQQFGQLLYEMMFSTSDNLGILQGVVESVCKQAHQEQTNEKDAALDILQRFIVKEPKKMGRFGVFLKVSTQRSYLFWC